MENSCIVFLEAVVIADNSEEKFVVLRQICCCSQQPAIAKFTLLHIKTGIALDEELRIITDFHWTEPFIATVRTTRVKQTLVVGFKLGVFEKSSRIEALLTD